MVPKALAALMEWAQKFLSAQAAIQTLRKWATTGSYLSGIKDRGDLRGGG